MRTKGGRRGRQGAGACARLSCNGFVYAVVHLHAAAVVQSFSLCIPPNPSLVLCQAVNNVTILITDNLTTLKHSCWFRGAVMRFVSEK